MSFNNKVHQINDLLERNEVNLSKLQDDLARLERQFGCSAEDYSDALQDAKIVLDSVPTAVCVKGDYGLAWAPYDYTTVTTTSPIVTQEKKVMFSCPCCGTHYLASDPGFIPNCCNCGAVMRKE